MNRLNRAKTHLIAVLAAAYAAKPAVAIADPPSRSFQLSVPIERNDHVDKSRNSSGIYERKELPPELSGPNVVKLTCNSSAEYGDGECHVYLVGTSHFNPVVFLELCKERRYWIYSKAGKSDEEFVVAANEAKKHGATILLGDRPISLVETEDLDQNTVDEMNFIIQECNRVFPNFMEVLVHERDKYISTLLRAVALEHNLVVAIVGKGHLPGIRNNWEQPIDVEQLIETPAISRMRRHIAGAIIDKIKP